MSWSLNEVEALAKKAAKGAGYTWGQAEDAARAVRWLEARGLDGAKALAEHLSKKHKGDCPITAGIAVSDGVTHVEEVDLTTLDQPLLFLPFSVWAGENVADALAVTPMPEMIRSHTDAETMQVLGAFAHRTYAPATEASRTSGAGAGLSDND